MTINKSLIRIGNFNQELRGETTTPAPVDMKAVDATWILICAFIVFTMQTGFGMLEAGMVSKRNVTNIILKNVADVILGGFTYWIFGYGITFGDWKGSNPFIGIGEYAVDSPGIGQMGDLFTSFFFQLSFATTATTIFSGAIAERCNFKAYCIYSCLATFTYSVQSRWVWGPTGFLAELGVIDIAGSGVVHLMGGGAALVGAWMLGPRLGRYNYPEGLPPSSHVNVLLGLFNLWWGWFAFNAGSSYGMAGEKWKFAARAATTTLIASIGGGIAGLFWCFLKGRGRQTPFEIVDLVNGIIGALVGITAGCSLFHTPEAFLTGIIGAIVAITTSYIPDKFKIDDCVSATAVHGCAGIWGMLAVGFFADEDGGVLKVTKGNAGLIRGGSPYLLGVQLLAVCCILAWSIVTTFIFLLLINQIVPLRVSEEEERLGLDLTEHGIGRSSIQSQSPLFTLKNSAILRNSRMKSLEKMKSGSVKSRSTMTDNRCSSQSRRRNKNLLNSAEKLKTKWTILLWRILKHLPSSKKQEKVSGWNPAQTLVQYTSPLSELTETTRPNSEVSHREQNLKPIMAHNGRPTIFEWTRNQEQEIIIVKTMGYGEKYQRRCLLSRHQKNRLCSVDFKRSNEFSM